VTDRLLTARTVADLLDLSTETVLRWVRRGELPAIRLPSGQLRFRGSDVDAWLVERATPRQGALTTRPGATHAGTLPSVGLTTPKDKEH
jgi:excisionase family DNA binding protein